MTVVEKKRPIRTCVACRSSSEKKELIRIVRRTGGEVEIDPTGKAPGRGAYICRNATCVAMAAKKKGLDRALRTTAPAELYEKLMQVVQENENAGR
ncbi:MAG: YlxR family protein [Armatimonadetes bacterium]|nr:YlxR family protein [Armatimonadota bacterium]